MHIARWTLVTVLAIGDLVVLENLARDNYLLLAVSTGAQESQRDTIRGRLRGTRGQRSTISDEAPG